MMTWIIILVIIIGVLLGYLLKGWTDGGSQGAGGTKYPRGGEKPINEFFDAVGPGARRAQTVSSESATEALDLAEQLLNRIDRKIDVLRELIRQADSRIETLGQSYQIRSTDMARAETAAAASTGTEPKQRMRTGAAARQEPEPAEDDKRSRIIKLRRRGLTSAQIAQEIGMGRGEVELILSIDEMG